MPVIYLWEESYSLVQVITKNIFFAYILGS
jgi:hypothetical protein